MENKINHTEYLENSYLKMEENLKEKKIKNSFLEKIYNYLVINKVPIEDIPTIYYKGYVGPRISLSSDANLEEIKTELEDIKNGFSYLSELKLSEKRKIQFLALTLMKNRALKVLTSKINNNKFEEEEMIQAQELLKKN